MTVLGVGQRSRTTAEISCLRTSVDGRAETREKQRRSGCPWVGKSRTSEGCLWEPWARPTGSQTLAVSSLTSAPPPSHTLPLGPHGWDAGSRAPRTAGRPESEAESSPGPGARRGVRAWTERLGGAGTPTRDAVGHPLVTRKGRDTAQTAAFQGDPSAGRVPSAHPGPAGCAWASWGCCLRSL